MVLAGIHMKGIYQHYKGNFYKVVGIAWDHSDQKKAIVIYNKCTKDGIYTRIKNERTEFFVNQPFFRDLHEFKEIVINKEEVEVERFKFIKNG